MEEISGIVEKTLLYDFYGELLTGHQKQVYEDVVQNDLSLGEAAEIYGISRQGIHDLIRRCNKSLLEYESKLHLVERFMKTKAMAEQMNDLIGMYRKTGREELLSALEELSSRILKQI